MSFLNYLNKKIILLIITILLTSACGGVKRKVPDADSPFGREVNQRFAQDQGREGAGTEGSLAPGDEQGIKEEDIALTDSKDQLVDMEREVFALKDIHFQFDKSDLDSSSRAYLETMATWLDENRSIRINIEGHADDRGTSEYNLALGARRADAVKRYLEILGVDSSRLSTISYGEEMPAVEGQNETAWAANRRVHFEGI